MLTDAAIVIGSNAIDAAITHAQANSGTNPGAAGTTGGLGARVAVNGTVDADGDITWASIPFTGLPANQPVQSVTFWSSAGTGSPATGGTYLGVIVLTGDATANSAGEFTAVNLAENTTAT